MAQRHEQYVELNESRMKIGTDIEIGIRFLPLEYNKFI